MTDTHGRFTWYELLTTDMEAARTFYADVLGWGAQDAGAPGGAYKFFTVGRVPVSGLMNLPDEVRRRGGSPCWVGYVSVADVDAAVARVRELGGSIHQPPIEVPGISRVAVVADPQMTTIALIKWQMSPQEPAATDDRLGRVSWHDLLAADGGKALPFYRALFGWQNGGIETSDGRDYQVISLEGRAFGGMYTKPAMVKLPFWLFYFGVGDIDVAIARVTAGGGRILEGPLEVPGAWAARCEDPQGVLFALVGPRLTRSVGYFERAKPRDPSDPRSRRWSW